MSASRDQSQKFTFVYQNLYHLYRKGKSAAQAAPVPPPMKSENLAEMKKSEAADRRGIETAQIIKAPNLNSPQEPHAVHVTTFVPPRLLGKHLEVNRITEARLHPARTETLEGLRSNLKQLQGLHERLRFMLKELEDLTKQSS